MTEVESKKESKNKEKKRIKSSKKWKRVVFSIGKWLSIPFLCVVALSIGLVLGYVYVGKRPMDEVYEIDTWRHLYDLVFSQT
ncbi:DNA-directed RNA polymerase subunit beta [Paenibacillus sp. UNC451MF]|uniref:DNA-directed RNA polymerase subunit beta n=1 Tax=Paenibacillus sp. UNC451MF TaxID=1449063 RepID=UPI00048B30DE|nr:DNA-directed RNA polymerase subunit beta [Paenibacillus sp. UNC451MF]